MTTHKVSAETPSTFFTAPTSSQNLRSPFRYKPPFFGAPALPPTPCLKNILGKAHTVKPNQLTRVLPRHTGRDSHITIIRLVWFSYVVLSLTPRPRGEDIFSVSFMGF